MKRNQAPVAPDELVEQARIIENRLENLLAPAEAERQICVTSKGYWLAERRHVRLESPPTAGHLLHYSSKLNYHYLEPLHALYCLEAGQLLVFHRGLPLSLAEAYELLISDRRQFTEYLVLQRLTRAGYICLLRPPAERRQAGGVAPSFEVYRRETYSSRRPKRRASNRRPTGEQQQEGRADYLIVVVGVWCSDQVPSLRQLLYLDSSVRRSKRGETEAAAAAAVVDEAAASTASRDSMATRGHAEAEIIFAVVDEDYSVAFTRCAPMAMTFN